MRVMHVIEAMHQGGAESLVVEHVRHAGAGVEATVCALNRGGPALEEARAAGARVFVLEKGGGRMRGIRRLATLMRAERIQVVNAHNPTGSLYGTLAAALAGVRAVVRTEHSIHYRGRHSRFYPWLIEPLTTALSGRVICVCEAVRESHVSRLRWARARYVTIANGVSAAPPATAGPRAKEARESLRRDLGLDPADRVVLTVGSLTRQKAQHVLVDAFAETLARVPSARLLIAGDGPLKGSLEEQARRVAPERVRFLGARGDVPELLGAADLYVLSSVREGLSVTLLEAMRAGRAAVATRIGGNAEAIADGVNGLIVPSGEPAALGHALADLLEDPARLEAFGAAGRERWMRLFTAERMVGETESLYRELLDGADARVPITVASPGAASGSAGWPRASGGA